MKDLTPYIMLIRSGEVVAFPTETVYGLGADAWNPSAISKVFEIKGRPSDNPLIVHVAETKQISDFTDSVPESAQLLIDEFWPGPLTIVFKKKAEVLDAVTAGLDTVAIRMPDHPLALELITGTGPLVAPSANTSGRPSPTKATHVREDFGEDFPVIEGGATMVGLESTVVDLTHSQPAILRPGSISRKEIEEVLGGYIEESFFHHIERPRSPGQKYSHYKPKAEVSWLSGSADLNDPSTLFLMQQSEKEAPNVISYSRDLNLLAKELYDRFRQADHEGFSAIVIEPFSEKDPGIASALYNRISKALS